MSESVRYYEFGSLRADVREQRLISGDRAIALTPKVFDTLVVFLRSAGRLLTKEELMSSVWPDTAVEESNLTVNVSTLRRVLARCGAPEAIETVSRRGYRFRLPVTAVTAEDAAPASRRILVLPLATPDDDADISFLGFGLADAIAGSIASIPRVVVRPPVVAAPYGGRTLDLAHIRADGAGDLVLAGSVLRQDSRVRVTVQLIDVITGAVGWAYTISAARNDLLALQDEIASQLLRHFRGDAQPPPRQSNTVPSSAHAFELYLRANQAAYETDHWETARDLYLACLREAPDFAPAWARYARVCRLVAKFGASAAVVRQAQVAAEAGFARALAIDPQLSLAHNLYAQLEVDTGRAVEAMCRLLDLARRRSDDPEAFAGLVHALRFCGLLAESLAAHDRARALDPAIATSVAHTRWLLGDVEGALQETSGDIGYMPGLALASLGRDTDAVAALRWRERGMRDNRARAFLVSLRALLEGSADESRAALTRAADQLSDPEAFYYIARTHARLGDRDPAIDALEQAIRGGFFCYPGFVEDSWLDRLRGDARFEALLGFARDRHHAAREAFTRAQGPSLLSVGMSR